MSVNGTDGDSSGSGLWFYIIILDKHVLIQVTRERERVCGYVNYFFKALDLNYWVYILQEAGGRKNKF